MESRKKERKRIICNERNVKSKSYGKKKCLICYEWTKIAFTDEKLVSKINESYMILSLDS